MDGINLLKREWHLNTSELPKFSYDEIYKMILKKSSSLVKRILYVGIAEFFFWVTLTFIFSNSHKSITNSLGMGDILFGVDLINYSVFIVFIVLFYKNYKRVKVTKNCKSLMREILRVRNTVRTFVFINVGIAALTLLGVNMYFYIKKNEFVKLMSHRLESPNSLSQDEFFTVVFSLQIAVSIVVIGLLILLYRLIYGIFLRKIIKNYKELEIIG